MSEPSEAELSWSDSDYGDIEQSNQPAKAPQRIVPMTPQADRTVERLNTSAGQARKRTAAEAELESAPVTPKRPSLQQLPTPAKTGHRSLDTIRASSVSPTKSKQGAGGNTLIEHKETKALLALIATLQPQLSERLSSSLTRYAERQGRLFSAAQQQQASLRSVLKQQQATISLLQTRAQLAKAEAEVFRTSAAAMRIEMASLKHERRCERAAAASVTTAAVVGQGASKMKRTKS